MSLKTLLKTPTAMGSAGVAGTGALGSGVGVGGWQIYEHVNPHLDRQMWGEGYVLKPPSVPFSEEVSKNTNSPFSWGNWDCANRLFKSVAIGHNPLTPTTQKIGSSSLSPLFTYIPSSSKSSPTIPFLTNHSLPHQPFPSSPNLM